MGALIDAAREPGDDDIALLAEAARQSVREGQSRRRGVARADDRDGGLLQRLFAPEQSEDGGRGVDLPQRRRIFGFAHRDEAHAELSREVKFAFDFADRGDTDRPLRPAASREIGQSVERGACAAAPIEQRAEGARADVFGSNEPQPVEPLIVVEPRRLGALAHAAPFLPILLSVPVTRRPMLALCFIQSRAASRPNAEATALEPTASATRGAAMLATSAASEE